jgi:hypothetical protein
VPQLLEDQGILIGGFGNLNQPSYHGGLPPICIAPFGVVTSAILIERIAWPVVLRPHDCPGTPDISAKPRVRLEICEGSKRSPTGLIGSNRHPPLAHVALQPKSPGPIGFGQLQNLFIVPWG